MEIRKISENLKSKAIPKEVTDPLEAYIAKIVKDEMKKLSTDLVATYYKGEKKRKNELITGMSKSLKKLAARIDDGIIIEARAREPEKQGEGAAAEGEHERDDCTE